MPKLQIINRSNNTKVYFVYLDPNQVETMQWVKGDNITVEYRGTEVILKKQC